MQDKINNIEKQLLLLQKEVETLKNNYGKLEAIETELHLVKSSVQRMEMVDKNIYDKLKTIVDAVKTHKDNFINHDNKETEKYVEIDKRLIKIERLMWMALGAFSIIELMHKYKLIGA